MNKSEFLNELKQLLRDLPISDATAALDYYSEAINDMLEDGAGESEIEKSLGTPDEIARQIINDCQSTASPQKANGKTHLSPIIIVLLILGSPIWLSLAIAAASIIITAYALLWTAVAVAWSIFVAVCASAVAALTAAFSSLFLGSFGYAAVCLGVFLTLIGVSILMTIGCAKLTAAIALLSKRLAVGTASLFKRKESDK